MTPAVNTRLTDVRAQLKKGVAVKGETVRTFLSWFGVERRGLLVVRNIRQVLEAHGIEVVPDFEYRYIDSQVEFRLKQKSNGKGDGDEGTAHIDPTYRIGRLSSAHKVPVSVKPDSTLAQAVTIMLTQDYSQLPVLTTSRDVKGVVSWKTIGSRLALKRPCTKVSDCMEPAQVLSEHESLFDAISKIAIYDYVLVQRDDRTISGIVTAADFNEQFRLLAEPFLLIGEIEQGLRQVLHGKFTERELNAVRIPSGSSKRVTGVADLAFGDYIRLIENEKGWAKLKIEIDRLEFVNKLNLVRQLRNDVMHFDPDGLKPEDIHFLREFAQFLKRLRDVGAI